jgi:hypothetical protein
MHDDWDDDDGDEEDEYAEDDDGVLEGPEELLIYKGVTVWYCKDDDGMVSDSNYSTHPVMVNPDNWGMPCPDFPETRDWLGMFDVTDLPTWKPGKGDGEAIVAAIDAGYLGKWED